MPRKSPLPPTTIFFTPGNRWSHSVLLQYQMSPCPSASCDCTVFLPAIFRICFHSLPPLIQFSPCYKFTEPAENKRANSHLYGRQNRVSPFSTSSLNCCTQSRKATIAWSNLLSQKNRNPPEQYNGNSCPRREKWLWACPQSFPVLQSPELCLCPPEHVL